MVGKELRERERERRSYLHSYYLKPDENNDKNLFSPNLVKFIKKRKTFSKLE
jgi:hypothetical protein